jgi:hypothetical protein
MASCCNATRDPRIPGGASSPLYCTHVTTLSTIVAQDSISTAVRTYHGHQHRQSSDGHTTDPSSSPDEIDVVVRSDLARTTTVSCVQTSSYSASDSRMTHLQSRSEHKYHTPHRDRAFTRDLVGDRRSDKGSDESSTLSKRRTVNLCVFLRRQPRLAHPNSRIDVSRPFFTASTLSSRAS